jgi:hypothetical protein
MTISHGRLNCYFFSLIIIFATLSGCASFSGSFVENCSRTYEDRGYVRMDNLTAEQRASLARRGLLP